MLLKEVSRIWREHAKSRDETWQSINWAECVHMANTDSIHIRSLFQLMCSRKKRIQFVFMLNIMWVAINIVNGSNLLWINWRSETHIAHRTYIWNGRNFLFLFSFKILITFNKTAHYYLRENRVNNTPVLSIYHNTDRYCG